MKNVLLQTGFWGAVALSLVVECPPCQAFPPAPNHTFYGMVRNEMGEPIMNTNAVVILETLTGVQIKTTVVPDLGAGMNYRLKVPMDAGLTSDAYKASALKPTVSFRMKVVIGSVTNLPIELHGNYSSLGKPAGTTHLDLTLGEDTDGDGLPDAWERALIAMMGGNLTLKDIKPGDDSDGDGMSNLAEYLAGTYAFDPADGLRLDLAGFGEGRPLLDFLAIRGRTYQILSSSDMKTWQPVEFQIVEGDPSSTIVTSYSAWDVRTVRAAVVLPAGQPAASRVYKLMVQ